jgi:hypothetical protein
MLLPANLSQGKETIKEDVAEKYARSQGSNMLGHTISNPPYLSTSLAKAAFAANPLF